MILGSGPPVSRGEPSSGTSTVVYSCGQHCFSVSLQNTGENVAEPRGNLSHSPSHLHSFRSSESPRAPARNSPGTPPKATGRQQPRPRPHLRASAMLAASLRPGPSLAAFPGTAQRSPVPFLPFPARLHHRPVLLSATAEGTGAPAGQGDASAAPLDEVRLPQVRFLSAS